MRTVRVKVYKFEELAEKIQKKVLAENYGINTEYNWWDGTYEDAARIGLKIEGFDLDRPNYCNGKLTKEFYEVRQLIKKEHGEECDTFKLAVEYGTKWDNLVHQHSDGKDTERVSEENAEKFDILADELEEEFKNALLNDYKKILRDEYQYLNSDEAIKETIQANEYEYHADGRRFI